MFSASRASLAFCRSARRGASRDVLRGSSVHRAFCTAEAAVPVDDGEDGEPADAVTPVVEDEPIADMKPSQIVVELDRHIVGQGDAKKAVAIAMRNRWRRQRLGETMRNEIVPKNILMIGPTGCGKTEIARRLSVLANAPFVKVEATKFTEVGFHGRDVDMIIRDLLENGIALTKKQKRQQLLPEIEERVQKRILEALIGKDAKKDVSYDSYAQFYKDGALNDQEIEVEAPASQGQPPGIVLEGGGQGVQLSELIGKLGKAMHGQKMTKKKMKVVDARKVLMDMEVEKLVDTEDIVAEAITNVEQNGIVFLDEIDKICSSPDDRSGDASAEGVQRDLLPLVEGSTISTKHGNVETDFILFIASGAFHSCKPSDLLPELQGRLPIRVELQGLKEDDLHRILTEPECNMIKQQQALMDAEGVKLTFEEAAVRRIAAVAAEVNTSIENIGARRLHTVVERLVEDLSFEAADMEEGSEFTISETFVDEQIGDLLKKLDLQKFIL